MSLADIDHLSAVDLEASGLPQVVRLPWDIRVPLLGCLALQSVTVMNLQEHRFFLGAFLY